MTRTLLTVVGVLSTSSVLLVDSALKGGLILLMAALVAMMLRRDSAATRHLVWLVAIVAMLVVPVFSAILPQWRVLPAWAALSHEAPVVESTESEIAASKDTSAVPARPAVALPDPSAVPDASPMLVERNSVDADLPFPNDAVGPSHVKVSENADLASAGTAPGVEVSPTTVVSSGSSEPSRDWIDSLPVVWAIGFGALLLRLLAARLLLWSNERRGLVIAVARQGDGTTVTNSDEGDAAIAAAFEDAYRQLGLRQRVRLLIHSERTIPVVWGILRCRLLLPAGARQWNAAQLRSVLLHELAHIKRRDTVVQLLAQFACAVHWFNPLVWFAAWRLHVERERACDDLVLANGVKPSAYAEHLLNVATRLSSSPWTQACGLAMARTSSLEDRLTAVLNEKRNRRSVTTAILVVALTLGAGAAIPVAMLRATETLAESTVDDGKQVQQKETPNSDPVAEKSTKTSKPNPAAKNQKTDAAPKSAVAPASAAPPAAAASELKPKHEDGEAVLRIWQANARSDHKIPGALIGELADWVKYFIELNDVEGEARGMSAKFKKLLPKFDATRDWNLFDAIALLDEVSAIHTIPLRNFIGAASQRIVHVGEPLPADLNDAPWGKPTENGLRAAVLIEPRAKEYPLGSSLKARIFIHNSGKQTAFFIMPSWQQTSAHTAQDAKDGAIKITSTSWTTMAQMEVYRLPPGTYCETRAPGLGVGPGSNDEDWANVRVGSWIHAKEGDDVRFTPGAVEVRMSPFVVGTRKHNTLQKPKNAADLWKRFVIERIQRETPIPTGAADRKLVLQRLVKDLYGLEPTAEEIAAFVADKSPAALDAKTSVELLAKRVQDKRSISPFTGTLQPGDIPFRVLAADPDSGKRPRVVTGSGFFNLGDKQRLFVEQTHSGDRVVNKATIRFYTKPQPEPFDIMLPDGRLTYGIVWDRDAGVLWIKQAGLVRSYDFTDPAKVKETRHAPDAMPDRFATALRPFPLRLQVPKPKGGAKLEGNKEHQLQWGEATNGLRAAVVRPPALGQPEAKRSMDFNLVVQNVSDKAIRLIANSTAPNPRHLTLLSRRHGWVLSRMLNKKPSQSDFLLQPREVAVLALFQPNTPEGKSISRNLDLTFVGQMQIDHAPPGAWTGKLVTANTVAAFAAHGLLPKDKDARELFELWNQGIRWNRTVPGGYIGRLADSVKVFTKSNPTWETTQQLLKMLPRIDATRDWDGHEALALLDELAAVQGTPIRAMLEGEFERTIQRGKPLPKDLEKAPWGEANGSGLRMAWLLERQAGEPQAGEYQLGTPLKSRILVNNTSKKDIAFRMRNWQQSNDHKAHDADGKDIRVTSTRWLTRARLLAFRLKPGQFIEVTGAGIGVGAKAQRPDKWKGTRVGSWIETKAGDQVKFTPVAVPLSDWNENPQPAGEPRWWLDLVSDRLKREEPVPSDDEVRRRLLYMISMDLFGTPVGEEYTKDFLADRTPTALNTLAKRLASHPRLAPFTGTLQSGPTEFRVLPAK